MFRLSTVATIFVSLALLGCSITTESDEPTPIPTVDLAQVSTPTPRPTQTPANTSTPQATATQSCTPRTEFPTVTVQAGETLFRIAQRSGATVADLAAYNCLANTDQIRVGQQLYVPVVVPPTVNGSSDTSPPLASGGDGNCSTPYFFTFRSDVNEENCPAYVARESNASGQDFEGGRAYFYAAIPGTVFSQDLIYVIYNDGTWESYPDTWTTDQAFNDPSLTPPTERYQPSMGIGKIWREEAGVRDRLGWAYEPEQPFTGRRQEAILGSDATAQILYIDHGARDLVLQLRTELVGAGAQTWIVAGGY